MNRTKHIRWVLAHEPIELFMRAAKRFSQEVAAKSGGRLEIEVMTLSEYAERYNGGKRASKLDLLNLMESGAIEMSQMYTTALGRLSKSMFALDLPFLFKDHEHASRVLDGPLGKGLMEDLSKNSNVRGLAFTYSGGFRMIVGNKPIRKLEDFKGLKIRVAKSPVAMDVIQSVGAEPVPMELEEVNDAIESGVLDGGESTYPRFYSMKQNEVSAVVNDTQHSLFLTSIIVAKPFWESLDANLQKIMTDSAKGAAKGERLESLEDAKVIKQKCLEDGIPVYALSASEQESFKAMIRPVYDKYESFFEAGLVKKIIDA